MRVEEGSIDDWSKLSTWHYRGHRVAVPRKIFRLVRGEELCGVIVYSYPPPACYGRHSTSTYVYAGNEQTISAHACS